MATNSDMDLNTWSKQPATDVRNASYDVEPKSEGRTDTLNTRNKLDVCDPVRRAT